MPEQKHDKCECETSEAECTFGKRNHFFRGKLMSKEAFAVEQAYGIERRRLLNRAVFGWGLVYGYKLDREALPATRLGVGAGLALAEWGYELYLPGPLQLGLKDVLVLSKKDESYCEDKDPKLRAGSKWVLAVHYAERPLDEVRLSSGCGCDDKDYNYVCETVVFSVRPLEGTCPCGEPGCQESACNCKDACMDGARGPHSCLCEWLAKTEFPQSAPSPCKWQGYQVYLAARVDLACLTISERLKDNDPNCKELVFQNIEDACGPRRLVKRNDLLYDLIRGCDLTHINWISWGPWHRNETPATWKEFSDRMSADPSTDPKAGFTVRFDGPVEKSSVTPDCFAFTAIFPVEDSGWRQPFRAPITAVQFPAKPVKADPVDTTREVSLVFDADWLKDEFVNKWGKFRDGPTTVELRVFGDLLRGCNGQAVDADGLIANGERSGDGTPGGTLFTVFRVAQKPQ